MFIKRTTYLSGLGKQHFLLLRLLKSKINIITKIFLKKIKRMNYKIVIFYKIYF